MNFWRILLFYAFRPFGRKWWFWLTLTGISLGLTVSCKWVGLFTIATIGVSTIRDLWQILGDLQVSKVNFQTGLSIFSLPMQFYL